MPGETIDKVLVLQAQDCDIAQIERELKDIPARKEEIQSRLSDHRAELESAREDLQAVQARLKELELEVAACDERIAKYRQQQLELKTNEEFKAMNSEISAVEKQIEKHEEVELEIMEQIDGAEAAISEKQAALKSEEDLVVIDLKAMDERSGKMAQRLESVQSERQSQAGGVDPEWLMRYDRIFANKRDQALVSIANGVCGGCHMKLPPQLYHDTQKQDAMVSCTYCGRLLY